MNSKTDSESWDQEFERRLPLLGHRNWIATVDAAYPLQSRAGIRTICTNSPQLQVVDRLLTMIAGVKHVRPVVYLDSELAHLSDNDAPGIAAYSADLSERLAGLTVHRTSHEEIITKLDHAAQTFEVTVFKSTLLIPYTSVFIELDCGYWTTESERALRQKMWAS